MVYGFYFDEFDAVQGILSPMAIRLIIRFDCVIGWSIKNGKYHMNWYCLVLLAKFPLFDPVNWLLESMFGLILDLIRFYCTTFALLYWPHVIHCSCLCSCIQWNETWNMEWNGFDYWHSQSISIIFNNVSNEIHCSLYGLPLVDLLWKRKIVQLEFSILTHSQLI